MREIQRHPSTGVGRARRQVGAWNRRRRSSGERRTEDGAPYDVWESISVKPTPSVIRGKGRRGRRPLRGAREGRFQWSREASGQFGCGFPQPLRHMPQRSFRCRLVGCTVLGAPWPRDRRGRLDATVGADRFCPRHPRRTHLTSFAPRMQFRGHSPRTIGRCIEIEPVSSHLAAYVLHPP